MQEKTIVRNEEVSYEEILELFVKFLKENKVFKKFSALIDVNFKQKFEGLSLVEKEIINIELNRRGIKLPTKLDLDYIKWCIYSNRDPWFPLGLISFGFVWDETEDGHEFWEKLQFKLNDRLLKEGMLEEV